MCLSPPHDDHSPSSCLCMCICNYRKTESSLSNRFQKQRDNMNKHKFEAALNVLFLFRTSARLSGPRIRQRRSYSKELMGDGRLLSFCQPQSVTFTIHGSTALYWHNQDRQQLLKNFMHSAKQHRQYSHTIFSVKFKLVDFTPSLH